MAAGQQNIEMNDGIFRVQYLLTNDRAVQPAARKCSNDAEAFVEREDLIKCWQQQFSGCQNAPDCSIGQVLFPGGFIVYGARYNNQVHSNGQKQIDVTKQASALARRSHYMPYRTLSGFSCKYTSDRGNV